MKKLVLMGVVTLAAVNVFAAGTSSLEISNATAQKINDLLATKPSQTNLAGTSNGVTDTTKVSGTATKDDAVMVGGKIKTAARKTADFLVKNVSKPVKASVIGAVNTLEYSANAATVGVTGMGGAITADGEAVLQSKPSQTNLAGTSEGVTNAQTLKATGEDTVASGAFSSNPAEQVRKFKKQQEEKKQLAHATAAQVYEIVIQVGATSPEGLEQLAEMGDLVSSLSGVALPNDEARVLAGASFVFGQEI